VKLITEHISISQWPMVVEQALFGFQPHLFVDRTAGDDAILGRPEIGVLTGIADDPLVGVRRGLLLANREDRRLARLGERRNPSIQSIRMRERDFSRNPDIPGE